MKTLDIIKERKNISYIGREIRKYVEDFVLLGFNTESTIISLNKRLDYYLNEKRDHREIYDYSITDFKNLYETRIIIKIKFSPISEINTITLDLY